MAIEIGSTTEKRLFRWLRRRYRLSSQLTAASHFTEFVRRVDFLFRDDSGRKIGIVVRNLRSSPLTGVGEFAYTVSEGTELELTEKNLNGVILVVLVRNPTKAQRARELIADHLAKQKPSTLANDLVTGHFKDGKFEPDYLERAIF